MMRNCMSSPSLSGPVSFCSGSTQGSWESGVSSSLGRRLYCCMPSGRIRLSRSCAYLASKSLCSGMAIAVLFQFVPLYKQMETRFKVARRVWDNELDSMSDVDWPSDPFYHPGALLHLSMLLLSLPRLPPLIWPSFVRSGSYSYKFDVVWRSCVVSVSDVNQNAPCLEFC